MVSNVSKRNEIFTWLNDKKDTQIICMQETHSKLESELKWKLEWGGDIYFNHGLSNSRGVMILFKKNVDYTIHSINKDKEGRWIIIDVTILNLQITLVNIYAPNEDNAIFFNGIRDCLNGIKNNQIVITGDFNTVLDIKKDRLGLNKCNNHPHAHKEIQELMASLDLVDIWRLKNPDTIRYTWRRGRQASRIDYFLISFLLVPKTLKCYISDHLRSDHALVFLQINNSQYSKGRGYWKFNLSLLHDEAFINTTKKFIKEFF